MASSTLSPREKETNMGGVLLLLFEEEPREGIEVIIM